MSPARKRITFVTPQFGRSSGGLGVSAERIVRSLLEHFDIEVLASERTLGFREVQTESSPGLLIQRIGGPSKDPRYAQFASELIVRGDNPCDIVVAFSLGREAYGAMIGAAMIRAPFIVCGRGDDVDIGPFTEEGWRIHDLLKRADRVVVLSEEMKSRVLAVAPGSKTVTIPNGVDPVLFPYQREYRPSLPLTLGLFGEIKWKKGIDVLAPALIDTSYLLRIVGSIRDESRKILHGVLSLYPSLSTRIEEVPYTDNVADLVRAIHSVDIVCIPSWYDGMPNVLLEAMSCGKVIVASAVGGARDVIRDGENGFLFRPGSVSELIRALARAEATINGGATSVRECARMTVRDNFTWEHEQSRYTELFLSILG